MPDSLHAMEPIDFDDIDALNAVASEEFGSWGKQVPVPQDLVDAFADLIDDHQWIHVDVERCRAESPFGAPIAHGFLVLSLMHQSIPRPIEVKGHKSAINYGAESLRFLAPVVAGSAIRARCRVVRAESTSKRVASWPRAPVGRHSTGRHRARARATQDRWIWSGRRDCKLFIVRQPRSTSGVRKNG